MIPDLLKVWATELSFFSVIPLTGEVQSKLKDVLGATIVPGKVVQLVQRRGGRRTQHVTTLTLLLLQYEDDLLLQGQLTAVKGDLPENTPVRVDHVLKSLGDILTEPVFFRVECHFLFPEKRYTLLFPLPISLPPEAANLNFDEIRGVKLVKKGKQTAVQEVSLDRQEDGNIAMIVRMPLQAKLGEDVVEYILGSAKKVTEQLIKPLGKAEAEGA